MSYPFQCQLKQLLKWSLGLLNTDSPPFPLSITLSNFRHFKKSGGTSAICLIRGKSDQSTRYIKVSKEALKNSINNNNFLKLGLKAQLIRTSLQWSKVSSRFLSPAPFLCALSHSPSLCSSHEAPPPVPKHQRHFTPFLLSSELFSHQQFILAWLPPSPPSVCSKFIFLMWPAPTVV